MHWILGIVLISLILFLLFLKSKKRKRSSLKKKLEDAWAKPKTDGYYNFDLIAAYFRNMSKHQSSHQIVDDRTFADLDLQEVFKYIDRTTSKIGQQYLYFKLRVIGSVEKLNQFETLVNEFQNNQELRVKSQLELSRLNSFNSYYLEELVDEKKPEIPRNLTLLYFLSATAVCSIILGLFYPIVLLLLIPVFGINMIFHYKNKGNVVSYMNGVSQLSTCLRVSERLSSFLAVRNFYKDFSFLKRLSRIEKKTAFIGFEKRLDNEYAAVVWMISELVKITFNIEYILFHQFLKSLEQEKESIDRMFQFVGEIDSAISCASVRSGDKRTCTPTFNKEKNISAKGLHHPLIEDCVPNDFRIKDASLLLTGSNMAGKTTFIRTIGISTVLAQTLNFYFATAYSAPFFKIYSSIGISDDILNGRSYYLQEVLRVKELVEASAELEPCLFILDELFKGTNTVERIAAGRGVLSHLNGGNNIVLVSTHDVELTKLLKQDHYELYHFSERLKDHELYFDHKLKPGRLKTRNAIKILEINDYPDRIIEMAKRTEADFDQHDINKHAIS